MINYIGENMRLKAFQDLHSYRIMIHILRENKLHRKANVFS